MTLTSHQVSSPPLSTKSEQVRNSSALRSRIVRAAGRIYEGFRPKQKNDNVLLINQNSQSRLQAAQEGKDIEVRVGLDNESSNLISNIIANNIRLGKRTLLLLDDNQTRNNIVSRLQNCGLADCLLDLTPERTLEDVITEVQRDRLLGEPSLADDKSVDIDSLSTSKANLDKYANYLKSDSAQSKLNCYSLLSRLVELGGSSPKEVELPKSQIKNWSRLELDEALEFARRLGQLEIGRTEFKTAMLLSSLSLDPQALSQKLDKSEITAVVEAAEKLSEKVKDFFNKIDSGRSVSEAEQILTIQALGIIDELYTADAEYLKDLNLKSPYWVTHGREIITALQAAVDAVDANLKLPSKINVVDLLEFDLDSFEEALKAHKNKGFIKKLFDKPAALAIESINKLCNCSDLSPENYLKLIVQLKKIQALYKTYNNSLPILKECLGSLYARFSLDSTNLNGWLKTLVLGDSLVQFFCLTRNTTEKQKLLNLLLNPKSIYENSDDLAALTKSLSDFRKQRQSLIAKIGVSDESSDKTFGSLSLQTQLEVLGSLSDTSDLNLQSVRTLKELIALAATKGYKPLIEIAIKQDLGGSLSTSLEKVWIEAQLDEIKERQKIKENPANSSLDKQREVLKEQQKIQTRESCLAVSKKHYSSLPNLEAGGNAGVFSHIADQGLRFSAADNVFEHFSDTILRVKPVVALAPSILKLLGRKPELAFDTVIASTDRLLENDDRVIDLGVAAKQLVVLNKEASLSAEPELPEKDIFADFLLKQLQEQGLFVKRNTKIGGSYADITIHKGSLSGPVQVAILTDGPNYHQCADTNTREFRIESEIEANGIPVIRTWVSDWKEKQKEKVVGLLDKIGTIARLNEKSQYFRIEDHQHCNIVRGQSILADRSLAQYYQQTEIDEQHFYSLYRYYGYEDKSTEWRNLFKRIVDTEGPIHKDLIKAYFLKAFGLTKMTQKAENIFNEASRSALQTRQYITDGSFFMKPEQQKNYVPRNRSEVKYNIPLSCIPKEEIESAIITIVNKSCGINAEDLCHQIVVHLGLKSLEIDRGLDSMVDNITANLVINGMFTKDSDSVFRINFDKIE